MYSSYKSSFRMFVRYIMKIATYNTFDKQFYCFQ